MKDGGGLCGTSENSLLFQLRGTSNYQLPQTIYAVTPRALKFVSRALVSPLPKSLAYTMEHNPKYLTIFNW